MWEDEGLAGFLNTPCPGHGYITVSNVTPKQVVVFDLWCSNEWMASVDDRMKSWLPLNSSWMWFTYGSGYLQRG